MNVPSESLESNFLQKPLSVGDWILTIIVLWIPFVGLVFLLYWALSSTSNVNRKNYSIAMLILMAIAVLLFMALAFLGIFAGIMSGISQ